MHISAVRPAVRPAYKPVAPAARPAASAAAAVATPAVQPEAGGRSGLGGLLKALFLNGFGSVSGLVSVRNDLKEFEGATGSQKLAHGVELAGDALNILSWPVAYVSRPLGAALNVGGWVTKTVGEMMAGRD